MDYLSWTLCSSILLFQLSCPIVVVHVNKTRTTRNSMIGSCGHWFMAHRIAKPASFAAVFSEVFPLLHRNDNGRPKTKRVSSETYGTVENTTRTVKEPPLTSEYDTTP